ncbi:FG-GAP-like repeat-containing protein [Polaromonas sp. LjRoot131]|uniref:FG-GAP-like repeat-containing protein n=1 Tax=Polaromonas sp. LjRoot131 TaxID=3342262 RepID=UPI003ED1740E
MQKEFRKALREAMLYWLGVAAAIPAMAQTTTVAGTMAGQFSVNESGAATYRIPIQVPPGVAGMEPKLELGYNSQGGNGLLGTGWSLSGLSAIGRCPKTMAQDNVRGSVNFSINDRYCLDGQRLILVSGTYGTAGSEYRTELDGFSRIIASGTAGNGVASFTVQSKAGLTMEYGNTADSRIEAQGKPTVRVWAVNKISDVKTNFMTFSYVEDSANGDFYPSRIDYSGNAAAGQAASNSVRFVYESRPDVVPMYAAGSLVKNQVRLKAVGAYQGNSLSAAYEISYTTPAGTVRPKVATIKKCDGASTCFAPLQFTYALPPTTWEEAPALNLPYPVWSRGLDNEGMQFVDVNGDGMVDIVRNLWVDGTIHKNAWLNTGDGWQEAPQYAPPYPIFSRGYDNEGIQFVDVNGDGLVDIVRHIFAYGNSYTGAWLNTGNGWQSAPQYVPPYPIYSRGLDNEGMQFVDVNGDGLVDIVRYLQVGGDIYRTAWLNTGNGWQEAPQYAPPYPLWSRGGDNEGIQFVDINGDGLVDMVRHLFVGGVSHKTAWLNTGAGWLEAPQFAPPYPIYSRGLDNEGMQFFDVNGDGLVDIVRYLVANGVSYRTAWLNTGSGWIEAPQFAPPYPLWSRGLDGEGMQIIDIDGDGTADYPRYLFANGTAYRSVWKRPESSFALTSISDGFSTTTVKYRPASKTGVNTPDAGNPGASTFNIKAFGYLVTEVEQSNGIGGTVTTQYSYGGLKTQLGTGRGLLGFRWMKSKNLANNIESYTEFNQNWPLTGSVLKSETRLAGAGNAGVLKRTTNSYAQGTGSATGTTFVYPSQSVEESWDLGGVPYPTVTNVYQYGQSPQYGDPTQISVSNSAGAGKTTVNEYWPVNTGSWILGRLKKATVTSVTP